MIDHALPAQLGTHAAQNDGRVRHGQRLGIGPHPVEVHELAVIGGFLLRPQGLHGLNMLFEDLPAPVGRGAVVLHFFPNPAGTHAEQKTAVGDAVQGRHLLGLVQGLVLDNQRNTGAQQDFLGHGCGCGQG